MDVVPWFPNPNFWTNSLSLACPIIFKNIFSNKLNIGFGSSESVVVVDTSVCWDPNKILLLLLTFKPLITSPLEIKVVEHWKPPLGNNCHEKFWMYPNKAS